MPHQQEMRREFLQWRLKTRPLIVTVTTCTYSDDRLPGDVKEWRGTEGDAEEVDSSGQNSDLMPSVMSPDAAEHGGGLVETTATHDSKDQDEPLGGTVSLLDSLDDPSYNEV